MNRYPVKTSCFGMYLQLWTKIVAFKTPDLPAARNLRNPLERAVLFNIIFQRSNNESVQWIKITRVSTKRIMQNAFFPRSLKYITFLKTWFINDKFSEDDVGKFSKYINYTVGNILPYKWNFSYFSGTQQWIIQHKF